MKRGDYIVLCLVGILAIGLAPVSFVIAGNSGDAGIVLIGPSGRTYVDASDVASDSRFYVQGRDGIVTFELSDGGLRAVESNCDTGVCVDSGPLSASNPILCAPNEVAAFIRSGSEYDAISR